MNELAVNPATALATAGTGGGLASLPQTTAVIQLSEWAAELSAARQIAVALSASNFLPKALREKSGGIVKDPETMANDAAAVILAGKSVGLDPLQSVQNIFPVHGMPSMYARTMGALVMAQGHETRRTAASETSVTYAVRRKGDADWQEFTWTIERADKAGYLKNAKYKSDPIAMLGAKALAEACRTVFPDILLGMAYSAEELELEDMGEVAPAAPVAAAAPARATITRNRPRPAAAAQAPASEEASPAPAATPSPVADQHTGEVIDEEAIPETVRANVAKITTPDMLQDYLNHLTGKGAPAHILNWVAAQVPAPAAA